MKRVIRLTKLSFYLIISILFILLFLLLTNDRNNQIKS